MAAGGSIVPTQAELRAKWTCDCEQLGLVRPVTPGTHQAAAVLCKQRREITATDGRGRGYPRVLAPARDAWPGADVDPGIPASLSKLYGRLTAGTRGIRCRYAVALVQKRKLGARVAVAEDQHRAKESSVAYVIQVQESWSLAVPKLCVALWTRLDGQPGAAGWTADSAWRWLPRPGEPPWRECNHTELKEWLTGAMQ